MDTATRSRVKQRISDKMNAILSRRIRSLGEDMRDLPVTNPFGSRVVPPEIWKGSRFERSFVTSFGQGVFEEAIDTLLAGQRGAAAPAPPDWAAEVAHIASLDNPRHIDVKTRFDLYVLRPDGAEEYYSLKTVKPNLDQTEIAKRDMLRITAAKPGCSAFLGLPYNPYGEGRVYGWTMPDKLFNMNDCPAVLIGAGFWNSVGHDGNTYRELLEVFDEIGVEFHRRIRSEYLQA